MISVLTRSGVYCYRCRIYPASFQYNYCVNSPLFHLFVPVFPHLTFNENYSHRSRCVLFFSARVPVISRMVSIPVSTNLVNIVFASMSYSIFICCVVDSLKRISIATKCVSLQLPLVLKLTTLFISSTLSGIFFPFSLYIFFLTYQE